MKKKTKRKLIRPTNVLNVFLALVILSTVVGYLIMFLNDNYSFDGNESLSVNEYEMVVSISDVSKDQMSFYVEGERLVIRDENTVLGTVISASHDEENNIITVKLNVIGTYTSKAGFKLNGKKNLASGDIVKLNDMNHIAKIISISFSK